MRQAKGLEVKDAKEPLVVVGPESGCCCKEDGADGTTNHTKLEWEAHVRMSDGRLLVVARVCANHKENYSHWDSLVPLELAGAGQAKGGGG